jgi:PhnB protein
VVRRVAEAGHLRVLGGQVHYRVEHQVHQGERAVRPGRGEVPDRDADGVAAGLGPQPGHHGPGQVDAVHVHAAAGQRQRDPAGADAQLQRPPAAGQPGQHPGHHIHEGRVEHALGCVVVRRRDALTEVAVLVVHHRDGTPAAARLAPGFCPTRLVASAAGESLPTLQGGNTMASRLNPYLNFNGNARQALEFYTSVFGGTLNVSTFAEFGTPKDAPDADKIMHGQLETEAEYTIMAADTPPGMEYQGMHGFGVSLSGDDGDALHGYWEKLSAAGTVTMPLQKQAWGDEFGMCTDQFGVPWLVNISQPQA